MAELIALPPQIAALEAGGYIAQPEGTIEITENGPHDVKAFANADVNVQPDLVDKTVTENGIYKAAEEMPPVDGYRQVEVDVPDPVLEHGSATPKTTAETYTPQGDGFSDFTVNPAPLTTLDVTPTTSQQTITPAAPNIGFNEVRVEAYVPPTPPDPDDVLVLVDWEGTPIKSYTHEEVMALTALPDAPDLPFYANVDHEYLLFQEWTHTLQEVKDYLQYRPYGHLLVGAIYTTTDGQDHTTYNNTRVQTGNFVVTCKKPFGTNTGLGYPYVKFANYPSLTANIRYCYGLKHINLRRGTALVNDACGDASSLEKAILPPTLTYIPYQGFLRSTYLSYVLIWNGTTSIGRLAFGYAKRLTNVELPKSVTSIGAGAFFYCSCLIDVIIHSKATLGSSNVFEGTDSNLKIYVPRENLSYFETATNWASIYSSTRFVAIEDNIDYLEHIGCDVHEYKEAQT